MEVLVEPNPICSWKQSISLEYSSLLKTLVSTCTTSFDICHTLSLSNRKALFGAVYCPQAVTHPVWKDFPIICLEHDWKQRRSITLLGDLNCNLLKSASHTTQLVDILMANNLQQLNIGGDSLIDLIITSSTDTCAAISFCLVLQRRERCVCCL